MFDFSLVTPIYFWTFLAVFIVTYVLIMASIARQHSTIAYVGVVISGVASLVSLTVLPDIRLSIGLLLGTVFIALIGTADETHTLSPRRQFIWQIIIASIFIYFGWSIPHITNPFSDNLLFFHQGFDANIFLWGALWSVVWVVFMMNSLNWLDGMDGLAGGVSSVAFIVLACISLLPATQDITTFLLSLIGLGATLAFLIWNFPPAKAYLGTSGSWFLGAYLAIVATIGGGKIATTLLVLAIPVLDTVFVVAQRLMAGRKPWIGDTTHHLHHKLKQANFSEHAILFLFIAISALLGFAAVTLQTIAKIWVFFLAAVMLAISAWAFSRKQEKI